MAMGNKYQYSNVSSMVYLFDYGDEVGYFGTPYIFFELKLE